MPHTVLCDWLSTEMLQMLLPDTSLGTVKGLNFTDINLATALLT